MLRVSSLGVKIPPPARGEESIPGVGVRHFIFKRFPETKPYEPVVESPGAAETLPMTFTQRLHGGMLSGL